MAVSETKICPKCAECLPSSSFRRRKAASGNECLRSWCKRCEAAASAIKAKADPLLKALYDKNYRSRHPQKLLEKQQKYRATAKGRAVHNESTTRRRALRKGCLVAPYSRQMVFERDEGLCWLCHKPIDPSLRGRVSGAFSIDHVTPISIGGTDTFDNVRAAHYGCNSKRGARKGTIVIERREVQYGR